MGRKVQGRREEEENMRSTLGVHEEYIRTT
jgi:hypothetical protein